MLDRLPEGQPQAAELAGGESRQLPLSGCYNLKPQARVLEMDNDAYRVLGVSADATEEQIRQAYHDLARVWHPDRFQSDPRLQEIAQERLREIIAAYRTLKNANSGKSGEQPFQHHNDFHQYRRPKNESRGETFIRVPVSQTRFSVAQLTDLAFRRLCDGRLLAKLVGAVVALSLLLLIVRIAPLIRPPVLELDLLAGRARLIRPQILSPARILDVGSDVKVAADILSEWARGEVLDLWKPESSNGSRTNAPVARTVPVDPPSGGGPRRQKQAADESAKAIANGTELIFAEQSGVGELRFINNTDFEEIAVLMRRRSPIRAIYIRPKSEALLKRIDTGVYEVHLELGLGADLKGLRFERAGYTPEPVGPFQFFSLTTASGTSGQHYEVVVNPPEVTSAEGLQNAVVGATRNAYDISAALGAAYGMLEDRNNAAPHSSKTITADPADAEAHVGLGAAYGLLPTTPDAVAALRKAISLDPGNPIARAKLGTTLGRAGQHQAAITELREAIRLKPDLAEAHFALALAYLSVPDRVKARAQRAKLQLLDVNLARKLQSLIDMLK